MSREKTNEEVVAEKALQNYRDLSALRHMDGWKVLLGWLEEAIKLRATRLCQLDCEPRETDRIRGELMLLKGLQKATSIDEADIREIETMLLGLRKQADAMHYVAAATRGNP